MSTGQQLTVRATAIAGLLEVDLPLHRDVRGWFKENWQREKMVAAGLPDFRPVQNNVSFNAERGTTRGLHAEPWDKYIAVLSGEIFGAWVDLRPGAGYGSVHTARLGPGTAVFVPRGVANGFQTLAPDTVYSYLVTEHWTAEARDKYSYVNLADAQLGIEWPIGLEQAVVSEADRNHPSLAQAKPVAPKRIAVLGGTGQLGRAFADLAPGDDRLEVFTRREVDLSQPDPLRGLNLSGYSHVINAAAMTAVDHAETPQGRREAWQVNAAAVRQLARHCAANSVTLVHVSTDYVFDGTVPNVAEDHPLAPLGVYGQSKAAGEMAVLAHEAHLVVRTSWVIGEGGNFVATMRRLAEQGVNPAVIEDQVGRPTFAGELARGIMHLIDARAAAGAYHLQCEGEPVSWYQLARRVFELCGHDPHRVRPTSAEAYAAGRNDFAQRPAHSTFDLSKLRAAGFTPRGHEQLLAEFLAVEPTVPSGAEPSCGHKTHPRVFRVCGKIRAR